MIKGKISVVMLVAFLLLASIAYTGMAGSVAATDPITVTVSVPEDVSGSFEATIKVEDVSNLNSGQFDLTFEPTVIDVIDVVDGEINGVTILIDGWELMSEDRIRVLFKLPGVETASGSGCLAKIFFEVKGEDSDTSELAISDGLLVDEEAEEIGSAWMNAAVTVVWPTVGVNTPEYVTTSFEATIKVEDVSNLNSGQFDLTFEPTVIDVIDVVDGEINGVTILIDGWELMSEDRIRVLFKLPGVETASGSGCLAKIFFEVKGEDGDTSELAISDGLLVDLNSYGMDANWNGTALTVAIGPVITVNAPAAVSDSFEVQIEVEDVTDLDAAQFDLSFDPDLLTVTSVSDGEINDEAVPVKKWSLDPAGPGRLRVILDLPGVDGVSGSGVLARIGFDPVGDGVSKLLLGDVILGDIHADDIKGVQLESSTVEVTLPGGTVISISDVAAVGTITVPITIENATNVGSCDLTLSYDPLIAIVSDVDGGDFDSLQANLEDAADGVIRIGAYQTSRPGFNGDVVLAEVTFMTMGEVGASTVLDLDVTTLKDVTPECNPIPYLVEDGSFTVLLKGDANGDGRIDMADCMDLAKHILSLSGFEQIVEAAVDVNGDGEIDMADCMYLAKHILEIVGFEELK